MTTTDDRKFVDVAFTPEELALIETVAVARGCTVPEFILQEALVGVRGVNALSVAEPDRPDTSG